MTTPQVNISAEQREERFEYRLDFYWQAIALYAVALLLYAVLKGSVSSGSLTIALYDPVVLLLGAVVALSSLFSLANWYMRRSIVVGDAFIRFRNRFRTRTFYGRDILSISVRKRKLVQLRGAYRVVKIRLANRRRPLRVRPSLYENERALIQAIVQLKRRLADAQAKP